VAAAGAGAYVAAVWRTTGPPRRRWRARVAPGDPGCGDPGARVRLVCDAPRASARWSTKTSGLRSSSKSAPKNAEQLDAADAVQAWSGLVARGGDLPRPCSQDSSPASCNGVAAGERIECSACGPPRSRPSLTIALADGALRATGLLTTQRVAIEYQLHHPDSRHELAARAGHRARGRSQALRLLRRQDSPLGRLLAGRLRPWSWAGAALGLARLQRVHGRGLITPRTTPRPLVLLLAILHQRVAARLALGADRPQSAALGLVAAGPVRLHLAGWPVTGTRRRPYTRRAAPLSPPAAGATRAAGGRAQRRRLQQARPTDPRGAHRRRACTS